MSFASSSMRIFMAESKRKIFASLLLLAFSNTRQAAFYHAWFRQKFRQHYAVFFARTITYAISKDASTTSVVDDWQKLSLLAIFIFLK